jgi:two-component sensor histidine kinase
MTAEEISNYLLQILGGELNITRDNISDEPDQEKQQILYGLYLLNEDIEYNREKNANLHESIKNAFLEISLVTIMTKNWTIEDANQNFMEFIGITKDEIINLNFGDLVDSVEGVSQYESLKSAIDTGTGWTGTISLSGPTKKTLWVDVKAFLFNPDKLEEGKIWLIGKDITKNVKLEAKLKSSNDNLIESLKRKEFLLRELHHRVKNNLQFISGVLFLQVQNESDERLADSLRVVQNKITAISNLHDILVEKASMDSVDLLSYLKAISTMLTFSAEYKGKVDISGDNVKITTESAPYVGIVLNELMTNSLKYAWDHNDLEKEIIIAIDKVEDNFIFHYSDNGKGYDRNQINPGLGTKLFNMLMLDQFKAKLVDCDKHPNCQCYQLGQEILLK